MLDQRCIQDAENLMKCRRYKEAEKIFTDMINNLLCLKNKVTDDSNEDEVRDIKKSLASLYTSRGFVRYKLVEFHEANSDYSEALKYDDSLAIALYNRGTVHYRLGFFDLAVSDLEKAVLLDSSNNEFKLALQDSRKQLSKANS